MLGLHDSWNPSIHQPHLKVSPIITPGVVDIVAAARERRACEAVFFFAIRLLLLVQHPLFDKDPSVKVHNPLLRLLSKSGVNVAVGGVPFVLVHGHPGHDSALLDRYWEVTVGCPVATPRTKAHESLPVGRD